MRLFNPDAQKQKKKQIRIHLDMLKPANEYKSIFDKRRSWPKLKVEISPTIFKLFIPSKPPEILIFNE